MQILYLILVISFFALVWAAFSMTRHVRGNATPTPLDPELAPAPKQTAPPARKPPLPSLASEHLNKRRA